MWANSSGDLYEGDCRLGDREALPAEVSARQTILAAQTAQASTDKAAIDAAKADAVIAYLVNHTPAECYDKVQADVTDLASAKAMLGKLAMALSVIARSQLR